MRIKLPDGYTRVDGRPSKLQVTTTTWHDLARILAQTIKVTITRGDCSLGRRKDQFADFCRKAVFDVSSEDTQYSKAISEARGKLERCVVASISCIPKDEYTGGPKNVLELSFCWPEYQLV